MPYCRLNYFICENEVWVEGRKILNFVSFESNNTRDHLAERGELKIPIHTVAKLNNSGDIVTGMTIVDLARYNIKVGAQIQVKAKYRDIAQVEFGEPLLIFDGFIKQIISGFPTTLILEDRTFILRFGKVDREWVQAAPLTEGLKYCCDVGNKAFKEFREVQGLTAQYTPLSISPETATSEFNMKVWKGVAPFQVCERLMGMFRIFTGIDKDGNLYMGTGNTFPDKATIELDTRVNVIDRDIKPINGMFENYYVEVNSYINGKRVTAKAGDKEAASRIINLGYKPLKTEEGLKELAINTWNGLRSATNAGTITTLLYPDVRMFDYVRYTDNLLPELNDRFYVIGIRISLGANGYRRVLTVTKDRYEW